MTLTVANIIAAILYAVLSIYLIAQVRQQKSLHLPLLLGGIGITLVFHALGIIGISVKEEGIQLSLFAVSSQIFWVVNLIVLISSLKKALHNVFIFLLPCSVLAVLGAFFSHNQSTIVQLNYPLAIHVVLSVVAYSLLIIATLQALLLAYQNKQLKNKTALNSARYLPPLQTMEALLFELLIVGELLLTLSIISGAVFLDNIFAQHLVHKTVLSIVAWFIYAFLLWGKFKLGWRGNTAIRWTLAGFVFLMLAYFGSRLVLEVILHRV